MGVGVSKLLSITVGLLLLCPTADAQIRYASGEHQLKDGSTLFVESAKVFENMLVVKNNDLNFINDNVDSEQYLTMPKYNVVSNVPLRCIIFNALKKSIKKKYHRNNVSFSAHIVLESKNSEIRQIMFLIEKGDPIKLETLSLLVKDIYKKYKPTIKKESIDALPLKYITDSHFMDF